jgi:Zn-dependent alcohol dehydrogenase
VPGPYDALVRIEVCGICNSTDAKLIDGTMFWVRPEWFVSHTWTLDEAPAAFEAVARGEVVKGLVVLHGAPAA